MKKGNKIDALLIVILLGKQPQNEAISLSASFVASKTLMNLHLRMCTYLIYMMCIQIQYGWYMVYESIQKTNGCFNVSKP